MDWLELSAMSKKDWLQSVIAEDDLGLLAVKKKVSAPTADEHLVAKFQEISDFVERYGQVPEANRKNMNEFMLHKRLESLRKDPEKCLALAAVDVHDLLPQIDETAIEEANPTILEEVEISKPQREINSFADFFEDDDLGLLSSGDAETGNIFELKHVSKERAETDFVARRRPCKDFAKYEEQLKQVQRDIEAGKRKLLPFNDRGDNVMADTYYILNGVLLYLESLDISSTAKTVDGKRYRKDGRTRCIFENGTESNMLSRSLAKVLYQDGRIISKTNDEEIEAVAKNFSTLSEDDQTTGFIYILSSKSQSEDVRNIHNLYKIGFAGESVEKRIANAENEPTYLMAPVKLEAVFQCYNMNAKKLESLLHTFFSESCLDIDITDTKGRTHKPREWFIAPLPIIDQAIEWVVSGEIVNYRYDAIRERIVSKLGECLL